MNCKICGNTKIGLKYKLINANVFVCANCNFHFTSYLDPSIEENRIIDDKPISTELKNYLSNQLQFNKAKFENQLNIVKQYIVDDKPIKILDVGCGGGLFLSMLKNENMKCYGIEPDIERLKFARQETMLNDIYPNPIESPFWIQHHAKSFDFITIWDVLEHVNDPKTLLEHASLLLKPGGLIIIDTPCRDAFYHRFGAFTYKLSRGRFPAFLNIMYSDQPFKHKQIFSKKDISILLETLNFEIIQLKLFHELSFPMDYYLNKLIPINLIRNLSKPLIQLIMKCLPIKNKMLIIAKREV